MKDVTTHKIKFKIVIEDTEAARDFIYRKLCEIDEAIGEITDENGTYRVLKDARVFDITGSGDTTFYSGVDPSLIGKIDKLTEVKRGIEQ